MFKVGLTGGIGSGKSYVARIFEAQSIPVYYADKEAKRLINSNKELKAKIKELLGREAYHRNGRINRSYVSSLIFNEKKLLKQMNAIIHPAVKQDFEKWGQQQKAPYVLEESAILFENKLHVYFDKTILVTADKEVRKARVIKRDRVTSEQVESRINNQWPDKKKVSLADFVIENNGVDNEALLEQILLIHNKLIRLSKMKQ